MGLFDIFKNNKKSEENNSDNFLENYINSNYKINNKGIKYSDSDIARQEKNCEILEKMGLPSYKELNLVPIDSMVTIEDKQELVLHMIFNFFVGRKAYNRLNNIGDADDADVMMLAVKYVPEFNQLGTLLSEISKGNIDENELGNLAFLGEQAVVLAWVLGLADKPKEDKVTLGSNLVKIFENSKGIVDVIEQSNIISQDDIMEYADYISRLDLYCMEISLSNKETKKLDKLSLDCIREHKSAIDMVTSFSIDKYLTKK